MGSNLETVYFVRILELEFVFIYIRDSNCYLKIKLQFLFQTNLFDYYYLIFLFTRKSISQQIIRKTSYHKLLAYCQYYHDKYVDIFLWTSIVISFRRAINTSLNLCKSTGNAKNMFCIIFNLFSQRRKRRRSKSKRRRNSNNSILFLNWPLKY